MTRLSTFSTAGVGAAFTHSLGCALGLSLCCTTTLFGGITGQNVVVGSATFIPTPNGWIIIPTDGTIIEYASFGVNANETIKFMQSGANARVLNRVLGDLPTNINGQLLSNGILYITNPAGVFIGPSGVVNVGGIYAAAGAISNGDFANGENTFTNMKGSVTNAGDVTATSVASFMGTSVVNSGSIKTGPGGLTALIASTGAVRLTETSLDPTVFVDVSIASNPDKPPASAIGVLNSGTVESGAGGRVLLGAGDVYSLAIRNTATSSVRTSGGLVRMKGGIIDQKGTISGERLIADGTRMDLGSDLRFDRTIINAAVTLTGDVSVRGEAGGEATSLFIQGELRSADGERRSLDVHAANGVFAADVGAGPGRLGSLAVSGTSFFGGNVTAQNDITVGGKTLFNDGLHDQRMTSVEGTIDFGDLFFKLGKSLTLDAGEIRAAGDGFAVGDLNIGAAPTTVITLDGGAHQRLGSYTKVVIDGVMSKLTAGDLFIDARDIETTGSIATAQGDLWLMGAALFRGVGDQSATAGGGDLHLLADARKTTAGTLDLAGESIFARGNVTSEAGGLSLHGVTIFDGVGDQAATASGGQLRAGDDVTKSGPGALTLTGDSISLGGSVSTTGGALSLVGPTTLDGEGDQAIVALGGALSASGNVVKTTGGDLTLTGDGAMTLGGDVRAAGGDVSLDADQITMDGAGTQVLRASGVVQWNGAITKAQGDLRIIGDQRIDIGGDVSVENGQLRFSGPMLLKVDTSMSARRAIFDGSIDGTYALVVSADERIDFRGAIGQNAAGLKGAEDGLRSLTLNAGGLVEFQTDAVRVAEAISFNAGDASGGPIPQVATIGASGDITFECGDFVMGPRQKFTVLGTLTIEAGAGSVTFGDVNTLNDLVVNAATIRIRSRDGGTLLTPSGTRSDLGTDLVAGGNFALSTVPIVLGGGTVRFASLSGTPDTNGTLSGFTLSLITDAFGPATLRDGGLYLDATLSPPLPSPPTVLTSTASPAEILAVDDPDANRDGGDADRAILRESERIAINRLLGSAVTLRRQLPLELERGGAGTVVFDEGEVADAGRLDGARMEVALPRLSRDIAVRFLGAHAALARLAAGDGMRERGRAIVARLESASSGADVESVAREVRADGDGRDADLLRAIAGTVLWGESFGLSDTERAAAGAGGAPFPQSRVMATLGLSACSVRGDRFGPAFWAALGEPAVADAGR